MQPLADNGGGEGTQLSNTVSFIPGREEWRPPHRYKPTADGDELATVVGPPGKRFTSMSTAPSKCISIGIATASPITALPVGCVSPWDGAATVTAFRPCPVSAPLCKSVT
ncbi:hypothetical protein [Providencia stuartii]|uniref:hypothetical protein n=1 Tax=Providencia stuartii TaxID=588 RepID=UPI0040692F69